MKTRGSILSVGCVMLLLSACGSSPASRERIDELTDKTHAKIDAARQTIVPEIQQRSLLSKRSGIWMEPKAINVGNDAELPAVFTAPMTLRFSGRQNLRSVAERITRITGIPVNLTPDVFLHLSQLLPGLQKESNSSTATSTTAPMSGVTAMPLSRSGGSGGGGSRTVDNGRLRHVDAGR